MEGRGQRKAQDLDEEVQTDSGTVISLKYVRCYLEYP